MKLGRLDPLNIRDLMPYGRHNDSLWVVYGTSPGMKHVAFNAIFLFRVDAEIYVRDSMEDYVGHKNETLYTIVEV